MKKIFILCAMLLGAVPALGGQLDPKFDAIVKQFVRDAGARNISSPTAAVFPYSCDEKLTRKRVDLAVGELLTARLMKDGTFKLAERTQLESIMKEQALGLSGAIDSAAAAQVGKLAGARLSVLGTVARVGNSYQISSKLVDTETSEIISASIVEVPLETFDSEASRYLVLVPEREALGLYLGFTTWPVKTKALAPAPIPGTAYRVVPEQAEATFFMVGLGIRYQFAQNWVGDLAIFPAGTMGTIAKFQVDGGAVRNQPYPGTVDGEGARLSINHTARLSKKWRALYGLGYQIYGFSFYDSGTEPVYPAAGGIYLLEKPSGGATAYGAFATGTLEFRLKERFAWSLGAQFNQPVTLECNWKTPSGTPVKVMEVDLPAVMATTALTFYF